jgi:hypothetical protein
MDAAGGKLPDDKDAAAVKKYFEKAYPDMDFERVYASDMKKMVKWFDILKKNNVEIVLSEQPEEEETAVEEVAAEPVAEVKPAKKTAAKKKEVPAEEAEAPKKTTRKKKTD